MGIPMVKAKNSPQAPQAPSPAPVSNFKTVMCRFYEKGIPVFLVG